MTDAKSAVVTQPTRLSVSNTPEGLAQIEIQLRAFRMTVTEANSFYSFRYGNIFSELYDKVKASESGETPKTDEEKIKDNLILNVYPQLAACSTGEVPTAEQFLGLPVVDMEFWIATAKELGIAFEWLDSLNEVVEKAGQENQKKGRKSPKK